ncbi:MAG: hypothetical protein JWM37_176 [Candidatus Saccharibacteria bacterium]|nr:hypothetical protein [Candidatus Saccharibacteria bacterium]
MAERKKLAIIDGKSVFYRGYYAMPTLATRDGTPTGGVYGFAVMALEVIKRLKPDYVCVAWDKPKTNIRRRLELYPEYKAGRKPAPPDFYEQVPLLHELLQAFGWPLYELDDYEADDIMGTLAVQAAAADVDTLLITSDMDMLQLINDHVKVFALKKGLSNIDLYSPESFAAKYGIDVHQFLDLKALKGDSSDNIPGVPGIGEKTAVQLLQDHQTLDGIYENIDLIKDSVRKKLVAGKDSAYLSKQLAAIWTDAPLTFTPEDMDGQGAHPENIQKLLNRFEFRTLARQLPEIMQMPTSDAKLDVRKDGLKPFALTDLTDATQLADIAVDLPLIWLPYYDKSRSAINQLVVAEADGKGFIITAEQLADTTVQQALARLGSAGTWVTYDYKSLLKHLKGWNITPPKDVFDIQIVAFILNSLQRDLSLAALAEEYLDLSLTAENITGNDMIRLEVAAAAKLYAAMRTELHKTDHKRLRKLYETIELPVIPVLADMELAGIELDTAYLKNFAGEVNKTIGELEKQIYEQAGQEFNIGSPSQLADILFNKLDLPKAGVKRGKTGYSTAASELDKLRQVHPIIDLITQYREVSKLKNTYIDTLPELVDEHSRVHTTFNLTIAQTGRLSSTDPNLQNIPVRTDLGRRIRTAFVSGKGKSLVSADYSQFELRLAAVMAGDTELIDMFNRGADIHQATAAQVYDRSPEDVTKQMRSAAKTINFGILYGMSPHGLSIATGMTREQAVHFIERYKKLRQPLFDYMDNTKEFARKNGYVETMFGRRRPMPDIHSSNFIVRQSAERAAINMPVQGTEADLMKMAMITVAERLAAQHNDCNMLLQIHDSILIECPTEVAQQTADMLKDIMENVYELPVRLDVDVTIAKDWGEL